jgi:putative iron-regulated protein
MPRPRIFSITTPLGVLISVLTIAVAFAALPSILVSVEAAYAAAPERVSKQAALAGITENVLLPGYGELTARCAELATAADGLAASPNAASLKRTQQAWVAALLSWRRTQSFVRGPMTDLNVYGRLQFWPLRSQSVEKVLRDKQPIDAKYIDALGATAVGLFPLESLLFTPGHDAALLATFTGPQGERKRTYVQAIARELEAKTRLAEKAWQSGYAAKFSSGGQDSLNLLVNDMLEAVEVGAQGRLQLVTQWHSVKILRPEIVEGGVSASSQQALLSLLVGAEERFTGGDGPGVDDYLRTLNARTADRVNAQFRKTIAAVRAINAPLDQATTATQQLVHQAHEECRALAPSASR